MNQPTDEGPDKGHNGDHGKLPGGGDDSSGSSEDQSDNPRSEAEQQQLNRSITDLFENRITFNSHLGMRIRELSTDKITIGFQMRPELVGHFLYGRLHGGVITSVLDATGGLAVMQAIADFHAHENAVQIMSRFRYLGTVDLRVDFLRQGVGESFYAEANVVRLGRRIAATSMTLHNNTDSPIATGNATYIVS